MAAASSVAAGFPTKQAAEEALTELLGQKNRMGHIPAKNLAVGDYLTHRWLPRLQVRAPTFDDYRTHVGAYVVPHIGEVALSEVTGDDLTELYDELLIRGRTQRPHSELGWGLSPTTVRHGTPSCTRPLRTPSAGDCSTATPATRPTPGTAVVKARAQATRTVWSWEQLRRFIATIQGDRLYPMWHLFATTGMRRGKMAGLVWRYVDLDEGLISIVRNAVPVRGKVIEQDYPKSAKSRRAIELDDTDVQALRAHRKRQAQERLALGGAWADPERVFTTRVGGRLYPPDITRMFHQLTDEAGLPRIRVQDLRHMHATLLLKGGENVKVVSERLGHSTTAFTMDTYAAYVPGMQRDAARRFSTRLLRADDFAGEADQVSGGD